MSSQPGSAQEAIENISFNQLPIIEQHRLLCLEVASNSRKRAEFEFRRDMVVKDLKDEGREISRLQRRSIENLVNFENQNHEFLRGYNPMDSMVQNVLSRKPEGKE